MEWRKLVLPLSGRYSSRTKRGFVSRAANPTSFTGTKFIQPPLACRHPLWPCGPASHFYKGLVSDLGSSPYLMWWAFRSPVRIGNEVSSVGWKKKIPPPQPRVLPAPIPPRNKHILRWASVVRKGVGWPSCYVQVPWGHHPISLLFTLREPPFQLATLSNRIRRRRKKVKKSYLEPDSTLGTLHYNLDIPLFLQWGKWGLERLSLKSVWFLDSKPTKPWGGGGYQG